MKCLEAIDTDMQMIFDYLSETSPHNPIITMLKAASIATSCDYTYNESEGEARFEAHLYFDAGKEEISRTDWIGLAEKYLNDNKFRHKVERLAGMGNNFCEMVIATAATLQPDENQFWVQVATKFLADADYRNHIEARAKNGDQFAEAVISTATVICQ